MVYGLQVWGDTGAVQIDQDYLGLGMTSKGSLSMTLDPTSHPQPMRIATLTVTGNFPVVAFASAIDTALYRVVNSGSSWTFYFRAQTGADFTLNYWVFDDPSLVTITDTYGLEVFTASGARAYHSGQKPIRVVAVMTPPTPVDAPINSGVGPLPGGYSATATLTSGRVYAVVQGGYSYRFQRGPSLVSGTDSRSYQSASNVSSNVINAGMVQYEFTNVAGTVAVEARNYGKQQFWVVDVTNY